MKNKFLPAAFFLLCILPYSNADTLTNARSRFSSGEYEQAAQLFQQYLDQGTPSAGVFYELGQAFSKSGNAIRAALNFRRALILDPRFAPARVALRETNLTLGIPEQKTDWRTVLSERISMDFLLLGGVAIFWIGAFALLLAFFRSGRGLFLSAFLIFVGSSAMILVWLCDPRITQRQEAMVLTHEGALVLDAPADQSEKITTLPAGSVVNILSQRGRWSFGELSGGAKGWFLTEGLVSVIPNS